MQRTAHSRYIDRYTRIRLTTLSLRSNDPENLQKLLICFPPEAPCNAPPLKACTVYRRMTESNSISPYLPIIEIELEDRLQERLESSFPAA
jgi:hypothetical protein